MTLSIARYEVMNMVEENKWNREVTGEDRPECFGDLSKVCPRDEDGIMHPRVECLPCGLLRVCLQKGLRDRGVIPGTFMEKPVVTKVSKFLRRWSDQKLADNKSKNE